MKRFTLLCSAVLLCVVALQAQEPVRRDGRPALMFSLTNERGRVSVSFVEDAGSAEPTLRFLLWDQNDRCSGWLHVSAGKVSWEPHCSMTRLEAGRPDIGPIRRRDLRPHHSLAGLYQPILEIQLAGKKRSYTPVELDGKQMVFSMEMTGLLERSLRDFPAAYRQFKRLTASVQPSPPPQASTPQLPPPTTLVLSAQPANVQVYVDDVFKGMTSTEGRLVIEGLAPGTHRVRMNLIGYTESARTVELKPGETATIEAKLEPAGPKPLALAEIEEALSNGLPPKGITKLVNQYGVDFALTKEVEQGLRGKGADDALLVAIATSKK